MVPRSALPVFCRSSGVSMPRSSALRNRWFKGASSFSRMSRSTMVAWPSICNCTCLPSWRARSRTMRGKPWTPSPNGRMRLVTTSRRTRLERFVAVEMLVERFTQAVQQRDHFGLPALEAQHAFGIRAQPARLHHRFAGEPHESVELLGADAQHPVALRGGGFFLWFRSDDSGLRHSLAWLGFHSRGRLGFFAYVIVRSRRRRGRYYAHLGRFAAGEYIGQRVQQMIVGHLLFGTKHGIDIFGELRNH